MAGFVISTVTTTAQSLASSELGIITQGGAIIVSSGAAVTLAGAANLTVLGVIGQGSGSVLIGGTVTFPTIVVGDSGYIGNLSSTTISLTLSDDLQLENAGTIRGETSALQVTAGDAAAFVNLNNSGTIRGYVSTAIIVTLGAGQMNLFNSGEISGNAGAIFQGSGSLFLTNTGTIASISGGPTITTNFGFADHIINSGLIFGDISLDGGDDRIDSGTGFHSGRVFGGAGADRIMLGAGESVVFGGSENDTLSGGAESDQLSGDDGNDRLFGGIGNDQLAGGTLDDTLSGDEGDDVLSGDDGFDRLSGGSGNDTLAGGLLEDTLSGDAGGDQLSGDEGNDRLDGDSGNDTLTGGAQDDTLWGGEGADVLDGGLDRDTVNYRTSGSGVDLNLTTGAATGGDAAGDLLFSIEDVIGSAHDDDIVGNSVANILQGERGADLLDGQGGNDSLFGGSGHDTVSGGAGFDNLTGGRGADVFVFAKTFGSDVIRDYDDARDQIDLTSFAFLDTTTALSFAAIVGVDVVFALPGGGSLTIKGIVPLGVTVVDLADNLVI